MVKLMVVTQGLSGQSPDVTGSWVTIGRADDSEFQILESSVSGRHCETQLRGDALAGGDLGSTNGTYVLEDRITEAALKPGQTLRLGELEFAF